MPWKEMSRCALRPRALQCEATLSRVALEPAWQEGEQAQLTVRAQTVLAQGREIMLAGDALRNLLAARAESQDVRTVDTVRSSVEQASGALAKYAEDMASNPPDAHAPRRVDVAAQPFEPADEPLADAVNGLWRQIAVLPDWRADATVEAPASEAVRT